MSGCFTSSTVSTRELVMLIIAKMDKEVYNIILLYGMVWYYTRNKFHSLMTTVVAVVPTVYM